MKDLILLVADKSMRFALQGALSRPEAIGIRPIVPHFLEHSLRDGGVRTTGSDILALERQRFLHALLVLDFEGSGAGGDALGLELELDRQLKKVWGDSAKAIVIQPELDVWMWGGDNVLRQIFRPGFDDSIRDWLLARGFEFTSQQKPTRPKEALEALMTALRRPRSASIYESIAKQISLGKCSDPAFLRMKKALLEWFPRQ